MLIQKWKTGKCGFLLVIFRPFVLLFLSVIIVIMMAVINILQLLSFPLAYLSRTTQLKVHANLAGSIWAVTQFLFETVNNSEIILSGEDQLQKNESAMIIANHCGYADFYLVHSLAWKVGLLGYCKYFAKVTYNKFILEIVEIYSIVWLGNVDAWFRISQSKMAF